MDIQEEAKKLHGGFADAVDIPLEEVEAEMESFVTFGVTDRDEVVSSVLKKLATAHDVDESELTGEGGDGYSEITLADVSSSHESQGDDGAWVSVQGTVDRLWDTSSNNVLSQAGLIDDGTARIKFVAWAKSEAPMLVEGESYRLEGVKTDEYEGNYEVQINSSTNVEMLDEEFETSSDETTIKGAIVDVQNGSGLIKRCPEEDCSKVLSDGSCSNHNEVDGYEFDLRMMLVLDTGERTYTAVVNRDLVEEMTGMTVEAAQELAADSLDQSAPGEEMAPTYLGKYFEVTGNLSGDWLFVNSLVEDTDIEEPEGQLVKARAL